MTVKLKGPENHGGMTFQGTSYEPDADGFVEVPEAALPDAFNHGFSIVTDEDIEKKAPKKTEKKPA